MRIIASQKLRFSRFLPRNARPPLEAGKKQARVASARAAPSLRPRGAPGPASYKVPASCPPRCLPFSLWQCVMMSLASHYRSTVPAVYNSVSPRGRRRLRGSSATQEHVLHVVVLDVATWHGPIHQGRGEPCCVLNGDLLRAPSLLLILRQLPPILLQKDLPP